MDYPLLDDFAAFICDTDYDALPPEVREESIRIILDSIGCGLVGGHHKRGKIAMQYGRLMPGTDATIIATGEKTSIFGAAFANAELINALDFDVVLPPGHVAPYVLAPALAVAEQIQASGRSLILANAIANELTNRIGKAMDYHRDVKGGKVAPPSVWGFASTIFGGVAAVAKLRDFQPETVSNAISLAAMASPVNHASAWREHSPPTTIKYTLGGWIAQGALTATHMAEFGHRGDAKIFDPEFGYPRFIGTERWSPENTLRDLGKVWNFPREETFKHYPHCRVLAGPLDVLIDIVRKNGIKPEEIDSINAWVEGFLEKPLWTSRNITDVTDAQFSVAHGLALGAHDLVPGPDWQDPANVYAPSVLSLMEKVQFQPHPDYVKALTADPFARPTRIEVHARGQVFAQERTHPRGTSRKESPDYFSTPELVEKFLSNASYVLSDQKAQKLADCLVNLADVEDMREVMSLIQP